MNLQRHARQGLKTAGAIAFALPVILIYAVAVHNNMQGGWGDILFTLAYMTIFSLGLPLFWLNAAWRMHKGHNNSDLWIMGGSAIGLLIVLAAHLTDHFFPGIDCSDEDCVRQAVVTHKTNASIFTGYILFGFAFFAGILNSIPSNDLQLTKADDLSSNGT